MYPRRYFSLSNNLLYLCLCLYLCKPNLMIHVCPRLLLWTCVLWLAWVSLSKALTPSSGTGAGWGFYCGKAKQECDCKYLVLWNVSLQVFRTCLACTLDCFRHSPKEWIRSGKWEGGAREIWEQVERMGMGGRRIENGKQFPSKR